MQNISLNGNFVKKKQSLADSCSNTLHTYNLQTKKSRSTKYLYKKKINKFKNI